MSGYLEGYGVDEQRRESLTKRVVLGVLIAVVVGLLLFFFIHNRAEKNAGQRFLSALRAHDYQHAYELWGCTASKPCPEYAYNKFMEDWGPKGLYADANAGRISIVDSCGGGVVLMMKFPNADPFGVWVDRNTKTLGFAPWPRCPGRHWHFWDFIKSHI